MTKESTHTGQPNGIVESKNEYKDFAVPAAVLLSLFSGSGTRIVESALAEINRTPVSIFVTKHNHADGVANPACWTLCIQNNTRNGVVLTRFDVGDKIRGALFANKSMDFGDGESLQRSGTSCMIDIPPNGEITLQLEVMSIESDRAYVEPTFTFYRLDNVEPVIVSQKLLLTANSR
ncbi:MAG TPA: hypothetical protein VMH86_04665 [Rhizomicrobium sp.]|nr:hypothetical protein [Rhizomicrobium sp.]